MKTIGSRSIAMPSGSSPRKSWCQKGRTRPSSGGPSWAGSFTSPWRAKRSLMEGGRGVPKRSSVTELEGQLHLYAPETYSYSPMTRAAVLGLGDGSTWWGEAVGDGMPASGEIVFNTAMTGYQEIASDASYNGQIVVLTYPLIGNYGTFDRAAESRRPWVEALVVRELVPTCRAETIDLGAHLRAYGVPGIAGIDTRALVRRLRAKGTLRGAILQVAPQRSGDPDIAREAGAKARATAPLAAKPLVVAPTGIARQ